MLVFAETRDAGGSALALQRVASKQELPLEDLVVVAAQLDAASASSLPRQLTCISARVASTDRRVVLALPIAVAPTTDESTAVQILDVGEVAVRFAHDVRNCFPTLVRRSPLSYAPSDSDDESDDDDDSDSNARGASASSSKDARAQVRQREKECADQLAAQQQREAERIAHEYMDHTRVKMLPSLHDLLAAFEIADAAHAQAALEQEAQAVLARASDSSTAMRCQWLCVDLPAHEAAAPSSGSASGASSEHNVGLLFSHAVVSTRRAQSLAIPLPRPPSSSINSSGGASDSSDTVYQDATVLSFGAKREATAHGGGKTPAEMVQNIRMRHASGTFCTLVLPATTWTDVAASYRAFLPQVQEIDGELRLRRVVGPAAVNDPLELSLESRAHRPTA